MSTYNDILVDNVLALGTSADKERAQPHYYHGTAPLQHAGCELEGACEGG